MSDTASDKPDNNAPHTDTGLTGNTQPVSSQANLLANLDWHHLSLRDQRLLKGIYERLVSRKTIIRNPAQDVLEARTFGERLADKIATIGGSWGFITVFLLFLCGWVALNSWLLTRTERPDPYPFILLNLLLSMLAALQAPIIMMSQNRQARLDREAAGVDYAVNLKAEVEIRELHRKLDELRDSQWVNLVAQQQEQIRLLETLLTHREGGQSGT